MVARSLLTHRLRLCSPKTLSPVYYRLASTATKPKPLPSSSTGSPPPTPYEHQKSLPPPQSWLTRKIKESPVAKRAFMGFTYMLGYNSKKQISARRAYAMYEKVCSPRADEERVFWQESCHLPPTFQSWFTVTNLHIWLLTVRLRALPDPLGKHYIQALIDHFFLDVEERVRAVLQPVSLPPKNPPPPSTTTSGADTETTPRETSFYTTVNSEKRPRGKAPERLVTRQMKILREQWAGLGMALDLGLVKGDTEMAGAVWRNLLGARGARGIVYPASSEAQKPYFRRSINLVGGEIEKVAAVDKKGLEMEEARDDGSGVHDFAPNEAGRYVEYPELMADLVRYLRRELVRLENIPDEQIIGKGGEGVEFLKFGRIRS